jgi:meso-butanediol dehydrogenase/(S,S)-butanediol dehydrogenase/diacetyl reductase
MERSAMITGAASGIGRAIAVRLATDGYPVSAADLPTAKDGLDGLAVELNRTGAACLPLTLDVTDADAVDAAVDAHVHRFGGLDVMVANAGIAITAPLVDTPPSSGSARWTSTWPGSSTATGPPPGR